MKGLMVKLEGGDESSAEMWRGGGGLMFSRMKVNWACMQRTQVRIFTCSCADVDSPSGESG